jgi:hypothetical protein
MKETLAKLTTNILNPFLASFIVIILLAFKDAESAGEALKWAAVALAFSILPVLAVVFYLVRRKKLDSVFANPRQQRTMVYIIACVLAAAGYGLLWYLGAPAALVAAFAAGLASIAIFMAINLFWKISLHTAFMAGAVTVLIIVYGAAAAWTVLLLFPVAWARMALKQHSIAQAAAGAILAAGIVAGIFRGYGVWG